LRIGVAGAGHLGKIHLNCLTKTAFDLVGFFDPDANVRQAVSDALNVPLFSKL